MKTTSRRLGGDRVNDGNRPLTGRELEILCLLAAGSSTAAIATELSISSTTVRNHVQRIITKLRVHSRLAAVARGYAKGLIAWEAGRGEE
jgi:ATP/maltotriose-dependent transcriptional regulator MalT